MKIGVPTAMVAGSPRHPCGGVAEGGGQPAGEGGELPERAGRAQGGDARKGC